MKRKLIVGVIILPQAMRAIIPLTSNDVHRLAQT